MDPDANIREQRCIAARLLDEDEVRFDDVLRLAELVQALDQWLQKGGALPREWSAESRPPKG